MKGTDWLLMRLLRLIPRLEVAVRRVVRLLQPDRTILLEYPVKLSPRAWNPEPRLYTLLDAYREHYDTHAIAIAAQAEGPMSHWPVQEVDVQELALANRWFSPLDAAALAAMIARFRPRRMIEVGSGNSTKIARRAAHDAGVVLHLTSIDPAPRAEINALCDEVIRRPLEEVPVAVFDVLEAGDICFIDSSHRALMHSDVTVFFIEILPRLRPGVLVHLHDIWLPYDYPQSWAERYYSEQYILAAYLLGGSRGLEPVWAGALAAQDVELQALVSPLWELPGVGGLTRLAGSFWARVR